MEPFNSLSVLVLLDSQCNIDFLVHGIADSRTVLHSLFIELSNDLFKSKDLAV